MDYLSDQILSFEKCVSNKLGPDIGNKNISYDIN
jgi:hypothetical protein